MSVPFSAFQKVTFKCLATDANPEHVYLNGRTGNGSANLAPNTNSPYSGTAWQAVPVEDGWAFKCLGTDYNPSHVYLNGLTESGAVDLAPNTEPAYSGTHWSVVKPDGGSGSPSYALKCLGTTHNPYAIYLDGRPSDGSVQLAANTYPPFTGTHWEIEVLPSDGK